MKIELWGKISADGYKIPVRCPICRSLKTGLSTYANGEKYVECTGCYSVIYKYPREKAAK